MTARTGQDPAQTLLDLHAVANLQGRYMYYLEAHRYAELLGLFALDQPQVSVEIGEGGIYVGAEKVRALFLEVLRPFFMMPGMMPVHMLTTPVIEVQSDGHSAAGMWQTLGCNSFPGPDGLKAVWQQGYYDNAYVRGTAGWRILRMRWQANFRTSFDRGWVQEPLYRLQPLDWSKFPERMRPDSIGGEGHEFYDPARVRACAPRPPEPQARGLDYVPA